MTDADRQPTPGTVHACRDAIKPEVARGVNYALQEVLNEGSGSLIQPRISTKTSFPIAAKTGTSNNNGSTWVVGHTTGLATAAWFGDALGAQNRAGPERHRQRQVLPGIDGYMIAGPMFSQVHVPDCSGLRHRPVPGTAVQPGQRDTESSRPPRPNNPQPTSDTAITPAATRLQRRQHRNGNGNDNGNKGNG